MFIYFWLMNISKNNHKYAGKEAPCHPSCVLVISVYWLFPPRTLNFEDKLFNSTFNHLVINIVFFPNSYTILSKPSQIIFQLTDRLLIFVATKIFQTIFWLSFAHLSPEIISWARAGVGRLIILGLFGLFFLLFILVHGGIVNSELMMPDCLTKIVICEIVLVDESLWSFQRIFGGRSNKTLKKDAWKRPKSIHWVFWMDYGD